MPTQTTAFALGILALLVALSVPAAITATDTQVRDSFDLDEDQTQVVIKSLEITLENAMEPDATITLRDAQTLDSDTQTISEGNSSTFTVANETVNVTVVDVEGNQAAQVSVFYPRTYGWAESSRVFVDNLPIMLVVALGLVVVGAVGALKP